MSEIIGTIFMLAGVFLILVAGIGLIRLPDLYIRMSSATKAATLGLGLILLGAVIFFGELGVASRTIATIVFVLLTAPVSAHMIGRAAYGKGVPLWEGTEVDELEGRYDESQQVLYGVDFESDKD